VEDASDWGKAPHPLAISIETFDSDNTEPSGRGLLARREISEGEELLVVPFKLCMTKDSAVEAFPEVASFVEELDDFLAIALLLMKERALGKKSFWRPYFEVLPSLQEVNPTFAWGEEELKALDGSPLLKATRSMQNKLQTEWSTLQEGVMKARPDLFPEDVFQYDYFVWAFTMLFSRAVRIRSLERGETLAMVPYADLINHSPFSNAFIDGRSPAGLDKMFNLAEDEVVLYSDRSYKSMEQVVISYGQKSNAELLLLYGFALDRNPYNSVDIALGLIDEQVSDETELDEVELKLLKAKRKFLDLRGRRDEAAFPLYADRYPEELLEYLRLLNISGDDFAKLLAQSRRLAGAGAAKKLARAAASLVEDTTKAQTKATVKIGEEELRAVKEVVAEMSVDEMSNALANIDFREYLSPENEESTLLSLKKATEAALERYPTTEQQDEAMMLDGALFRKLPREVRMSIRQRRGEKQILHRTLEVLGKDIARMQV